MNNDLISREALKKDIDKFIGYLDEDMICRIKVVIDNAPTVENTINVYPNGNVIVQERPQCEWIEHEDGYNICPYCKHKTAFSYLFCPNCGADMREGSDK